MKLNIFLPLLSLASAATFCPSRPAETAEQLTIFYQFVQKFIINKDVKSAFTEHVDENCIQHNPNLLSGRQKAIDALTPFVAMSNFTILHAGFYNNTGYIHYRVDTSGAKPTVAADIVRMEGSCIMDHWDVTQVRPENPINPLALW
jgi:predicted SnoaL-like aldol condensation-catalyzing enzyme